MKGDDKRMKTGQTKFQKTENCWKKSYLPKIFEKPTAFSIDYCVDTIV